MTSQGEIELFPSDHFAYRSTITWPYTGDFFDGIDGNEPATPNFKPMLYGPPPHGHPHGPPQAPPQAQVRPIPQASPQAPPQAPPQNNYPAYSDPHDSYDNYGDYDDSGN